MGNNCQTELVLVFIPCCPGTFHDFVEMQESEEEAGHLFFPSLVFPLQALRSSPSKGQISTEADVLEAKKIGFQGIS